MAAVSLSRADSRLDEDPPGSRHLRFIAAIVGAVLPRHYWSRFDTVLPVSRAALGSSIATIFLAALIFIPASLRYAYDAFSNPRSHALAARHLRQCNRGIVEVQSHPVRFPP